MTRALLEQALEALSRPRPQNSFYQRACDDADVAKAIRAYLHEQPLQLVKHLTAMQALEALDELESSARGDEPFNHAAAPVVRAFIEGAHLAKPDTAPAWHDAPDVPGLWINGINHKAQLVEPLHIRLWSFNDTGAKWFGPIPSEDK